MDSTGRKTPKRVREFRVTRLCSLTDERKRVQNRKLLRYARLLRVEKKPMSPYLQGDRMSARKRRILQRGNHLEQCAWTRN